MASITHALLLPHLICTIILQHYIADQSTALTLDLVHRYAPQSPFYNDSLTRKKLFRRTLTNESSYDLTSIRPMIDVDPHFLPFLVKVNLGTFSDNEHRHKSYFLDLDTGSTLTWLQCEDCKKEGNHCFRQIDPPYPNSKSTSYRPLFCDQHPKCTPEQCDKDSCHFELSYADNSHAKGVLAHENFTFPLYDGREEIVTLLFGCGVDNRKSHLEHRDQKSAGIFGIGWGGVSFVNQIHSISKGRFAYCLPLAHKVAQGSPAFLRFGYDIPAYWSLPSTRMLLYENDQSYYAKLLDISISDAKLNIPYAYFEKGEDDIGGCNFDTGSTVTRISPPAYQMFKQALLRHIEKSDKSLEMADEMDGYDVCYRRRKTSRGYVNLPAITFHFDGNVDLVVKPEAAFHREDDHIRYEYFCLEMVPSDDSRMTVIGSHAQANQFIVYDVPRRRLYFGPRDCSQNP